MTTKTRQDPDQTSQANRPSIPTPEKIAEMMEQCGCGLMMMQMMEHCARKNDRQSTESAGC